jgi:hypothetical protein
VNFSVPVPSSSPVPGVPEFVSPEAIEKKAIDQRSNIYSLGALYYFLLVGRPPYQGERDAVFRAHLSGQPTPPSRLSKRVTPEVDAVVLKALEVNSSKRFMTLAQFLGELERFAGAGGAEVSTQPMGRAGEVSRLAEEAAKGKQKDKGNMVHTLVGVGAIDLQRGGNGKPPAQNGHDARPTSVTNVRAPEPAVPPGAAASLAPPLPRAHDARAYGPTEPAAKISGPGPGPHGTSPRTPVVQPPQPILPGAAVATPPAMHANAISSGATVPRAAAAAGPPGGAPMAMASAQPTAPPVGRPSGKGKGKGGGGGGGNADPPGGASSKNKFRETMWFKKGELDEAAAQAAARAVAEGKEEVVDRSDSMPIEDRYADDGSLTRQDQERLSLRTGHTVMMDARHLGQPKHKQREEVSERDLVSEMRDRKWVFAAIAALALVILGITMWILS